MPPPRRFLGSPNCDCKDLVQWSRKRKRLQGLLKSGGLSNGIVTCGPRVAPGALWAPGAGYGVRRVRIHIAQKEDVAVRTFDLALCGDQLSALIASSNLIDEHLRCSVKTITAIQHRAGRVRISIRLRWRWPVSVLKKSLLRYGRAELADR
jgi:hypothetical protein